VDGLVTFTMDSNAEIALARELGVGELRFFSQVGYGGGHDADFVRDRQRLALPDGPVHARRHRRHGRAALGGA
jgi:hypothetical protein